jgi:Mg2+-importing ATPase
MNKLQPAFWSIAVHEMLQQLQTTAQGLTTDEARARLTRYEANLLKPKKKSDAITLLLSQFKSPLILILLFATGLSFFLYDPVNALIILTIVRPCPDCCGKRERRILSVSQKRNWLMG